MTDAPADAVPGLFEQARAVAGNAYAPYSRFRVGAAVRTAAGRVHLGCNMENVAFPVGICAERAALARAVAEEGPALKIQEVEVVAIDPQGAILPCTPCGACRQAILELGPRARVRYRNQRGQVVERAARQLLPGAFDFDEAEA